MADSGLNYPDLWILLIQAYNSINQSRRKELRKYKLSSEQAALLSATKSFNNYAKPIDIARRIYREPQTISTTIDVMSKKGLIKITQDSNRKNIVRITLTPKGEQVYQKVLLMKSINQIMSVLTEEKCQQLQEILMELVDSARKNNLTKQESWITDLNEE